MTTGPWDVLGGTAPTAPAKPAGPNEGAVDVSGLDPIDPAASVLNQAPSGTEAPWVDPVSGA